MKTNIFLTIAASLLLCASCERDRDRTPNDKISPEDFVWTVWMYDGAIAIDGTTYASAKLTFGKEPSATFRMMPISGGAEVRIEGFYYYYYYAYTKPQVTAGAGSTEMTGIVNKETIAFTEPHTGATLVFMRYRGDD